MPDPNAAAFERVFHAEHAALVAFCFRRLNDRELARDLTAETFRIAWSRWDESRRSDRAWLFGVARNLIGNEYSRRSAGRPVPLLEEHDTADGHTADPRLLAIEVQTALATLSRTHQEVLRLTYWEQLSASEVAASLGTTTAAIWVRLTRARHAFAAAWADQPTESATASTGSRA